MSNAVNHSQQRLQNSGCLCNNICILSMSKTNRNHVKAYAFRSRQRKQKCRCLNATNARCCCCCCCCYCCAEEKKENLFQCFVFSTIVVSINKFVHSWWDFVCWCNTIDARHFHHRQATITNDLHCYDLMHTWKFCTHRIKLLSLTPNSMAVLVSVRAVSQSPAVAFGSKFVSRAMLENVTCFLHFECCCSGRFCVCVWMRVVRRWFFNSYIHRI